MKESSDFDFSEVYSSDDDTGLVISKKEKQMKNEIKKYCRKVNSAKGLLIESGLKIQKMVEDSIRRNHMEMESALAKYEETARLSRERIDDLVVSERMFFEKESNILYRKSMENYHELRKVSKKIMEKNNVEGIETKIEEQILEELESNSFQNFLREEILRRKTSLYDSMFQMRKNVRETYLDFMEEQEEIQKFLHNKEKVLKVIKGIDNDYCKTLLKFHEISANEETVVNQVENKKMEESQPESETTEVNAWDLLGESILDDMENIQNEKEKEKNEKINKNLKKKKKAKSNKKKLRKMPEVILINSNQGTPATLHNALYEINFLKKHIDKLEIELGKTRKYGYGSSSDDDYDDYSEDEKPWDIDDEPEEIRNALLYCAEHLPKHLKRG